MEHITVKVVNKSQNPLPQYSTEGSAGMDLRASLSDPITLEPMQRCLVPTGVYIQLPHGYQCEIRPRSGLAIKHGITVLNTPGTVDADYRGEICVILVNLSTEPFVINNGERVCQMVINTYVRADWEKVEELDTTERGDGGFGHTGLK